MMPFLFLLGHKSCQTGVPPFWPPLTLFTFLQAPSPNTVTLGLGLHHVNLEEHISAHSNYWPVFLYKTDLLEQVHDTREENCSCPVAFNANSIAGQREVQQAGTRAKNLQPFWRKQSYTDPSRVDTQGMAMLVTDIKLLPRSKHGGS